MTYLEAAEFLKSHDNYLLLTHKRPDGDTIGSAVGLCELLRTMGKTAWLLPSLDATRMFQDYLQGHQAPPGFEPDTVVSVDVASLGLLPQTPSPTRTASTWRSTITHPTSSSPGRPPGGGQGRLRRDHLEDRRPSGHHERGHRHAAVCGGVHRYGLLRLWQHHPPYPPGGRRSHGAGHPYQALNKKHFLHQEPAADEAGEPHFAEHEALPGGDGGGGPHLPGHDGPGGCHRR